MTAHALERTIAREWWIHLFAAQEERAQEFGRLYQVGNLQEPLFQTISLGLMHSLLEQGFKAAAWTLPSSRICVVALLTPTALFAVAEVFPQCAFLQHQFGNMCRVAVVVSQVAVFYFTGNVFALVFVGLHVMDTLERKELLPKRIVYLGNEMKPLVYAMACISAGGALNLAWGLGTLVTAPVVRRNVSVVDKSIKLFWLGKEYYFFPSQKIEQEVAQLFYDLGLISREKLENAAPQPKTIDETVPDEQLEIDLEHLTKHLLPQIPNVDPRRLLGLWDEVMGRASKQTLQNLINDYTEHHRPWENISSRYLQLITSKLLEQDSETQRRILLSLNNELSDRAKAIENAFSELFWFENNLPEDVKIHHQIHLLRSNLYFDTISNPRKRDLMLRLGFAPDSPQVRPNSLRTMYYTPQTLINQPGLSKKILLQHGILKKKKKKEVSA